MALATTTKCPFLNKFSLSFMNRYSGSILSNYVNICPYMSNRLSSSSTSTPEFPGERLNFNDSPTKPIQSKLI